MRGIKISFAQKLQFFSKQVHATAQLLRTFFGWILEFAIGSPKTMKNCAKILKQTESGSVVQKNFPEFLIQTLRIKFNQRLCPS
jgi:hypothetical protein